MKSYHSKTGDEVLKIMKTSLNGLTLKEAKVRLQKYGKNILKETHKLQPLKIFFEQFKSFLIYVLLIAAIISFFLSHKVDAIVIFAVVLINAGIGFFQQYRAEKAIINLRKLLVEKTTIVREGKHLGIESKFIVPGDILFLKAGDKINADCRILKANNLEVDESILTGESLPIKKLVEKILEKTTLAERKNMLYAGTQIVNGSCMGVVVATSMNTEFGQIASKLQDIEIQKTPMQKRLDVFSRQISFIILGLAIIIFILGFLKGSEILEMFMVAVTLAVGAIPEGLPAVLAIAFAIASNSMAKSNVVTRRLPAVESLGSVTIICTDKTGTLTEQKMSVQEIFTNNNFYEKKQNKIFLDKKNIDFRKNKEFDLLFKTSVLCNNARFEVLEGKTHVIGDPTEEALVSASLDLGYNKKSLTESQPSIQRLEFDSKRKMMSVLRDNKKQNILYSKGATEKILSFCNREMIDGEVKKLSEERKKIILTNLNKMEEKALRILSFAYKEVGKKEKINEENLIFLGFMGMIDPPRPEVKQAIKETKSAGIEVKIITGDSVLTATAIAKQIGVEGRTITGQELEKMSDAILFKEINEIVIFARTTPHQKLRISQILQQRGEVVAMTGDGINDVLALKSADVGIAMGIRGTDVARDVSDVVLVDDNFASIVQGIKQGRKTYDNVKKFTKYMLSVNFSTIFLVMLLTVMGFSLPIIPLQILWKNIITDSFPALTLVLEEEEGVMKTKPRREKSILSGTWRFILFGGIMNFLACGAAYFMGIFKDFPITEIRTMVVTTGIVFELLFVYTCRSKKSLDKIGFFSNKWLNYAILLGLALHLALLYTPPLASIFHVVPLSLNSWLLIAPLGLSGLAVSEGWKYFRKN